MRLARSGCMLLFVDSGSLLEVSASRVAEEEDELEALEAVAGVGRTAAAASFLEGFDFFGRGAGEGEETLRAELELASSSLELELSLELESDESELELDEDAEETLFFLFLLFPALLSLELLSELESELLLLLLSLLLFFETLAFFAGRSSSLLLPEEEDESLSLLLESELLEPDEEEARLRFFPTFADEAELEPESLLLESLLLSSLESSTAAPPAASLSLLWTFFAACVALPALAHISRSDLPSPEPSSCTLSPFFLPSFSKAATLFS